MVKIDRVTHYHKSFALPLTWCFYIDIGKSVHTNYSLLMPAFSTLPHNVVQQGNLKHSYLLEH